MAIKNIHTEPNAPIIEMQNVGIRYDKGPEILSDIKLSLRKGSFHFLTGQSGAGKTSLLSLMYLSQKPSRFKHYQQKARSIERTLVLELLARFELATVLPQNLCFVGALTTSRLK